jgi:hypothetical protein
MEERIDRAEEESEAILRAVRRAGKATDQSRRMGSGALRALRGTLAATWRLARWTRGDGNRCQTTPARSADFIILAAGPVNYDRLWTGLGGLEPSKEEDRILRWLAKCDEPTIAPIALLFERLRARNQK